MEKTFVFEDGRTITKAELEGIIGTCVDAHIKRREKSNQGRASLKKPKDLRAKYAENLTKFLYKKLGIPQNYFN